ncbi:MAG: LD-carboxypeptidase, partial [Bdellovibrionales bacterium]|nr:LD-carboxypeptidase [Bdellovibrionales bacterium]NQZ17995.1 LD-carboxypeptidase [Bdellovibrionales bacterium]
QGWTALEPGDVVDIVAPGMKPRPGTIPGLKKFLKSWGLRVRIDSDIIQKDLICSHSKEYRLKSLKKALMAKDSKMVWCMRGGYGSLHLVEGIKKIKKPQNKIFMGLSDITTLHSFFNQEWGWSTLHGSNIDRFALGKTDKTENKKFKEILFGEKNEVSYSLKAVNAQAGQNKKVTGHIVGGNLITLQSSFGTSFQFHTKGKILFFEDIGERAYRVDRVFEHMKQLKMWTGVKAVVFGQFTGGREPDGRSLVPSLLKQWASQQSFPVFSGLPSGHGDKQRPLPLNTKTIIQGGKKPKLVSQSGVRS